MQRLLPVDGAELAVDSHMRPLVKLALAAVVVAAIIFTAAALYLALVFDANRYKPELAAAARQATGRELAIDGDLAFGLFPQPHVRVGAARLLNPQGFDGAVVEFRSARANVRLLPLLRRQIQIDELLVDGLHLSLLKNRKGENNWPDPFANKSEDSNDGKRVRNFDSRCSAIRRNYFIPRSIAEERIFIVRNRTEVPATGRSCSSAGATRCEIDHRQACGQGRDVVDR